MPAVEISLVVERATSIAPTMGALYIGAMLTAILYGSTNIQTFLYYKNFPGDHMFQKCALSLFGSQGLFPLLRNNRILDLLHMIFTIIEFWHYLIDSFGDYNALLELHWLFSLQILISVLIILVVQRHLLHTANMDTLNRYQRIWSWILILVLLAVYAAGFLFLVKLYSVSTLPQLSQLRWSIIFGLSMSSFDDFMLAIAICHFLAIWRTTFEETKSRLWTIMTYAVISGALTSIFSLTSVITVAIMPHNLVFQGIEFLVPKLYVNSYLAMLNARKGAKNHRKSNNLSVNTVIRFGDSESRQSTSHESHTRFSTVATTDPKIPSSTNPRGGLEVKVDVVQGGDQSDVNYANSNLSKKPSQVYESRGYAY
ncbi:hypothetical protein F5887DRAFT_1078250 [Amanita rubescens]|nr:hypothetical protein F5887DRAFT_1078250 [Amanita rubescens]